MMHSFEVNNRISQPEKVGFPGYPQCLVPHLRSLDGLSPPVNILWIMYVISVVFCYVLMHTFLLMPCGHLLGKSDLLALVCDV